MDYPTPPAPPPEYGHLASMLVLITLAGGFWLGAVTGFQNLFS